MTSRRCAVIAAVRFTLLAAAILLAASRKPAPARADRLGQLHQNGSAGREADRGVGDTDNVAAGNRLSSVRVIKQNTNDDEQEWVRFCFRNSVQRLDEAKASSFAVIGPDPAVGETARDVTLDNGRKHCVLAGFESGTDLRRHTLGAVEGGAVEGGVVENRDRKQNIADSAPLSGGYGRSSRNRTAGPDLTGIRISATLNRVEYHFDEDLDEHGGANAAWFGFYTEHGDARTGSRIVSVDGRVVTVQFDDTDQVDTVRRGFVRAGAISDGGGAENGVGTIGGRTSNPDLTGVRKSAADTQYDYTFDDNISQDVDASDFVLVTDTGKAIEGESADVDGREVHVTFAREIEDYDSGDIVLAAANPDADAGEAMTLGAEAIGSPTTRPGRTTGPDLVGVSTDVGDRLMTLTFDKRVDDENDYDGSGIHIATGDDQLVTAGRIIEVEGRKVYVKADQNDLDSLVGVTLEPDTIEDSEGNGNPLGTVAHGSASTLGGTSALYGRSYGNVN
jgi:hypothetical protein